MRVYFEQIHREYTFKKLHKECGIVARFINYNNAYLSTLFVSYTGLNFKTYLDSIRINRAVKLIKHTDLAVSEISAQCGFVNIRTFNNVFRRVTGMTPSQLRKTNST